MGSWQLCRTAREREEKATSDGQAEHASLIELRGLCGKEHTLRGLIICNAVHPAAHDSSIVLATFRRDLGKQVVVLFEN